jgi:hypothetical protein
MAIFAVEHLPDSLIQKQIVIGISHLGSISSSKLQGADAASFFFKIAAASPL